MRTIPKRSAKRSPTNRRAIKTKAIQLLNDPLFLYRAWQQVKKLGVIGESRNILILVLAGIARTLPKPAHVLIQGPTSSGKTTLIKTTLQLFPPSCVIERAGLSGKALVHGKGSLAHKILFIQEYRCGKDAQQLLRLLQSEGRVTHEFTA
jgi:energy-coupling factor transporter ATP-binding protein EcfA2